MASDKSKNRKNADSFEFLLNFLLKYAILGTNQLPVQMASIERKEGFTMRSLRYAALTAAMLLTASLWGCGLFPEEEEILAPPLAAPAAVTYTTTKVSRGTILDSVTVSGTFVSTRSYDLSFEKRAGYLSEVTVKAGDLVKKGQFLARLDTDSMVKELSRQKLLTERAKIALDAAKAAEGASPSTISGTLSMTSAARSRQAEYLCAS